MGDIEKIMKVIFPDEEITEETYNKASGTMAKEDFKKEYYTKVITWTDPMTGATQNTKRVFRHKSHSQNDLIPTLLYSILETQKKAERHLWTIKTILLIFFIVACISALFFAIAFQIAP